MNIFNYEKATIVTKEKLANNINLTFAITKNNTYTLSLII